MSVTVRRLGLCLLFVLVLSAFMALPAWADGTPDDLSQPPDEEAVPAEESGPEAFSEDVPVGVELDAPLADALPVDPEPLADVPDLAAGPAAEDPPEALLSETEVTEPPVDDPALPEEEIVLEVLALDEPLELAALGLSGFGETLLSQGQAGTTLSADKTATGFWERRIVYDWTVEKSVNPTSVEVGLGASGWVEYSITATRTQVSVTDRIGVSGQICVTNGGDVATENLTIVDRVQYKTGAGQFQDLAGATQTIIPSTQLGSGESNCYAYEIEFTPVAGAVYRNVVKVTITNHSGHLGEPFGPEPKADFSLPGSPTIIEIDEEARVNDVEICPAGFTCTPSDAGPWYFTGSGSATFNKEIHNVSAPCDEYFYLSNTATLTELDTGQQRTAGATVTIYSGACPTGCTRTIGYWKTHAGFTGRNADRVTPLLPVWLGTAGGARSVQVTSAAQAVDILSMNLGEPSNGITKLYAQLLAAKLNIATGADGSAVAAVISQADVFLAQHRHTDWSSLSRQQRNNVLQWMSILDNYNNGYIGPGHCSG